MESRPGGWKQSALFTVCFFINGLLVEEDLTVLFGSTASFSQSAH